MISTPIRRGLAFGRAAGVDDGGRLTGLSFYLFVVFVRLSRDARKSRELSSLAFKCNINEASLLPVDGAIWSA